MMPKLINKHKKFFYAIVCLTPFLVSCKLSLGSITPSQEVIQSIRNISPLAQDIRISGISQAPDGKFLAVYSFYTPSHGNLLESYHLGYVYLAREPWGFWQVMSGSGSASNVSPMIVDYIIDQKTNYTIVFGQVVDDRVSAVEAVLDNGEVMKDVTKDKYFILYLTNGIAVCKLNVLDQSNQPLDQIGIEFDPTGRGNHCQP